MITYQELKDKRKKYLLKGMTKEAQELLKQMEEGDFSDEEISNATYV